MNWSDWTGVERPAGYAGCAAYRIRLVAGGEPVTIQRFLGTDETGILCIGQTTHLDRRRRRFMRGMTLGSGHSEGNLLHIVSKLTPFQEVNRGWACEYSYLPRDTKAEVVRLESELLRAYLLQFGEAPPLNSAIPGRRHGGW